MKPESPDPLPEWAIVRQDFLAWDIYRVPVWRIVAFVGGKTDLDDALLDAVQTRSATPS